MTTQYFERPGGRIAYDDQGAGRLVIAAPGMGDTRRVYRHVREPLLDAGIRLVTMDLRGLGESSTGWSDYSDTAVASDLLALIDHLGDGPAVIVGNSLSCASAVLAAVTSPERVTGIVLIGPFVRQVPLKWWQAAAFKALLGGPWGRRAWVRYYRSALYPGSKPPDHEAYVAELAANLAEPGRFEAFRALARNTHAESGAVLDRVEQPSLVIMGTADPDFPDATAEAHHVAGVIGGETLLCEGSGHYPQADAPEAVAPAIADFVGRI